MLLDWTLPDFSGVEVCRRMRQGGISTPVLMITALGAALVLYMFVFGSASHFNDAAKEHPKDIMGIIYTGGIIVPLLLMLTIMVSAPIVGVAVLVGLLVSVMQAVTQIQDQTVSIVPKIVLMLLTMLLVMPWALTQMMQYSVEVFGNISHNM